MFLHGFVKRARGNVRLQRIHRGHTIGGNVLQDIERRLLRRFSVFYLRQVIRQDVVTRFGSFFGLFNVSFNYTSRFLATNGSTVTCTNSFFGKHSSLFLSLFSGRLTDAFVH